MKKIITCLSICILILGCDSEESSTNPHLSGDIEGWVSLYDDLGNSLQDKSGVTISIDNTKLSTISISNGYWKINEVSAGIYNFLFQKDNFFTVKYHNVQFVGGGTYYLDEIPLRKVPSVFVTELEASSNLSGHNINFKITTSNPDTINRRINVLISKSPVDSSGLIEYIMSAKPLLQATLVHTESAKIIDNWYYSEYELIKGEPLYLVAYVLPIGESSSSISPYNPATKQYEFYSDNVTLSNMVMVTVP